MIEITFFGRKKLIYDYMRPCKGRVKLLNAIRLELSHFVFYVCNEMLRMTRSIRKSYTIELQHNVMSGRELHNVM